MITVEDCVVRSVKSDDHMLLLAERPETRMSIGRLGQSLLEKFLRSVEGLYYGILADNKADENVKLMNAFKHRNTWLLAEYKTESIACVSVHSIL